MPRPYNGRVSWIASLGLKYTGQREKSKISRQGTAMNLKERLMTDLKQALRDRDVPRREAIRMVRAAIKNAEIELQRNVTDEQVQAIISREIRRRTEALGMFRKAGRDDLVAEEEAGLAALQQYLPEQLSRDQIAEIVGQIITDLGATGLDQLGPVMREAMAQLKGQADGRLVNQVAREMLAG